MVFFLTSNSLQISSEFWKDTCPFNEPYESDVLEGEEGFEQLVAREGGRTCGRSGTTDAPCPGPPCRGAVGGPQAVGLWVGHPPSAPGRQGDDGLHLAVQDLGLQGNSVKQTDGHLSD